MRATTIAAGIALATALAACPALARNDDHRGHAGAGYAYPGAPYPAAYPQQAGYRVDRALAERCGLRAGSINPHLSPAAYYDDGPHRRDSGIGGALIGGAVGGLVGNRIAGRGDRAVGTIAGAAIGAVAGAAIDRAEDERYADGPAPAPAYDAGYASECEAILPPGYMLVSVPGGQECRDEVVTREEWVPEYVTVPGRPVTRAPPRDKRTKLRRVK